MNVVNDHLRRLAEQEIIPPQQWTYLQFAIVQLGHINTARNLILHYGIEDIATKEAHATDAARALSPESARNIPIPVGVLKDMTDDLMRMLVGLYTYTGQYPAASPQSKEWLFSPWQYSPPQQQRGRRRIGGLRVVPSSPRPTPDG